MILKEWNVWHIYSTYFLHDIPNLKAVAENLVNSGVLRLGMTQDGEVFYREKGKLKKDRAWAEPSLDSQTTVHLPGGLPPYEQECLGQAALMAYHESQLFRDAAAAGYLRGYLDLITLTLEDRRILLYPQIKLYENGILLTQFRVLSGDERIETERFISTHVNLYRFGGREVGLPPSLLTRYASVQVASSGRLGLLRHGSTLEKFSQVVDAKCTAETFGDFSFTLTALDGDFFDRVKRLDDPPLSLRLLSQIVEYCVADAVQATGSKLPWRRSGYGETGGRWLGRPAVYLIDYEGRGASAGKAVCDFKEDLGTIMIRTTAHIPELDWALGPNHRRFDDYALFVNSTLTLWLFADLDGLASGYGPDVGERHFILEKHIQVELIEYLHATHLRIEEESSLPKMDIASLRRSEHAFGELRRTIMRASPFGEVVELLRAADSALGHDELRSAVLENVRLRTVELSERSEDRKTVFGWALTVLLGISVIPSVADGLVKPSLKLLGWWQPPNPDWQVLFYNAESLLLVLLFGLVVYLILLMKRPVV